MCEAIDRETLLEALSIIDWLDDGWRPGDAEIEDARYIESWAILPRDGDRPFKMIGIAWSLPLKIELIVAPVVALDRARRWARLWHEWVAIGDPYAGGSTVDTDDVRTASLNWLHATLQRLPLQA